MQQHNAAIKIEKLDSQNSRGSGISLLALRLRNILISLDMIIYSKSPPSQYIVILPIRMNISLGPFNSKIEGNAITPRKPMRPLLYHKSIRFSSTGLGIGWCWGAEGNESCVYEFMDG